MPSSRSRIAIGKTSIGPWGAMEQWMQLRFIVRGIGVELYLNRRISRLLHLNRGQVNVFTAFNS